MVLSLCILTSSCHSPSVYLLCVTNSQNQVLLLRAGVASQFGTLFQLIEYKIQELFYICFNIQVAISLVFDKVRKLLWRRYSCMQAHKPLF